jgi:hypothetical protein
MRNQERCTREEMHRAYENEMRETVGEEELRSGKNRRDVIGRHK